MRFRLNRDVVDVDVQPSTTVLEYVRSIGLTGTKEGCASGDCGACTVMLADGPEGFRTANACIMPVGQLAGKHLVTVEGLGTEGCLHPAQQAMVDSHGSQCGFCTPGFVMSLATLVENGCEPERERVLTGISGNLCRCTGYRPIVEAGIAALHEDSQLSAEPLEDIIPAGHCLRPESESELQEAIRLNQGARLIAGGTDLMLEVTQLYRDIDVLIDLSAVRELNALTVSDAEISIGAAVSYSRFEQEPVFSDQFLKLLHRLGSRQIRNAGTVGGNLANGSPIADMPPVLMAWDAELEIVNVDGRLRRSGIAEFYHGYRQTDLAADEYIARIIIPRSATKGFHRFYKNSKRIEDDIASVMGAIRLEGDGNRVAGARIAFGGMAATPVRLNRVEGLVTGEITDDLIREASDATRAAMTPLTDVRASAEYRSDMAAAMVARVLREFCGEPLALVTEL